MNKIKKVLSLLIAAAMMMAFAACGENNVDSASTSTQPSESQLLGAEDQSSVADNSENIADTGSVQTLYDPNFSIELLDDGIKKVTDGDGRELILVPKSLGEVPSEYSNSIVIRTPVENAVFLSATQVCTFRTVDDAEIIGGIGGVTDDMNGWSDIPAIAQGLKAGDILNVGGSFTDPDYELIQSLEPDVVFVYGGAFGQQDIMTKLEELGINYAVDNEYLETNYLTRMEWMRFLLTFFDADSQAETVMQNVQTNVEKAKQDIEGQDKPTVAIFCVYYGVVYATDGSSWVGSMVADMGADNVFEGVEVINISYEAAYEYISQADIIIYSDSTVGTESIAEAFPQITECRAYENGRVYQYADSFWNGIDQSNIIACDMAAVFYPDVFESRELSYFAHLEK